MSEWNSVVTNQLNALTQAQKINNALIITGFFRDLGWTDESIAGMLGNMEIESQMNPGQFQAGYPMTYESQGGFGLVQWTPVSKFASWAGQYWMTDYNRQLYRIRAEYTGTYIQWIPVAAYDYMTFYQYSQSTASPAYLAMAWEYSYERGTPATEQRQAAANYWYTQITGQPAPPLPPDPPAPSAGIPKWLLLRIAIDRRNYVRQEDK